MNEQQYYNPIVQAMMHLAQTRIEQARMQQQGKQHQDELKIAQQRADQEEERIKNEHEYQTESLANAHEVQKSLLAQRQMEELNFARQLSAAGGDLSKIFPQGSAQGTVKLPSGQEISPSSLPTQAQIFQTQRQQNQMQAADTLDFQKNVNQQITRPEKEFEEDLKAKFQKVKDADDWNKAMQLETMRGKNQQDLATTNKNMQMSIVSMEQKNANWRAMLNAGLSGVGDDSGAGGSYATRLNDAIWNADIDPSKLKKPDQNIIRTLNQHNGEVTPNSKDYYDGVHAIATLQPILDQALDNINKYSIDSPGQGIVKNLSGKVSQLVGGPPSDAQAAAAGLKGNVDKFVQGSNIKGLRITQTEMNNKLNALFDPTKTKAQNLANYQKTVQDLKPNVDNLLSGADSDRANTILMHHGITSFGSYGQGQKPGAMPSDIVTDSKGQKWQYKGIGDRLQQANYNLIPQGTPNGQQQ